MPVFLCPSVPTKEVHILIFIFNNGVREWLIDDLKYVVSWLPDEEEDMRELTEGIIDKLSSMTDKEFTQISKSLIPQLDKDE